MRLLHTAVCLVQVQYTNFNNNNNTCTPSRMMRVELLFVLSEQKEFGMPWAMRVVPLFETLDDLDQSEATMR